MENEIRPFYVTFGVQFSRHPGADVHPLGMVKEGYAVIEAPDMELARKIARAIFGDLYAFIRDEEEFIDGGIAAKWHHEGELLRIGWFTPERQHEMMLRELHHFETEQELAALHARIAGAASHADALEGNWESGDLAGAVNETVFYLRALEDGVHHE